MRSSLRWGARFLASYLLFVVLFVAGTLPLAGLIPADAFTEPGLVSPMGGLLIVALVNVLVVGALILTSRGYGWKLAAVLAFAYYGAVTFQPQIETWYFLSALTVDDRLLRHLFVMGIPTAFVFVPLAVWILGKGLPGPDTAPARRWGMSRRQWLAKLAALMVVYVALYWGAGYFIAWQNPELRAFYGEPGEPLPFFSHTLDRLRHEPLLFLFQALRALVWVLIALPIIYGSRVSAWWTALVVGLLFSLPQNVGQILANPLMPIASVRLTHMVETAVSTFAFGVIVVWLLHREHRSLGDLVRLGGGSARGPENSAARDALGAQRA